MEPGERQQPTIRPLPLAGGGRAVGGPVPVRLLGSYFAVALAAWVAACAAGVAAAGDLAAGRPLADGPVLAAHLVGLGALPFAVSAGSFHLLPVMLRNDLISQRALWAALPLLGGGFLAAPGVAGERPVLVWVGAGLLTAGFAIVIVELTALVVRAPRGRMLVASRAGVLLSCLHAAAALVLGGLLFREGRGFAGVRYVDWLLVHLHVALVGWIALLIVAVGRTLAPMLALAPAAPPRRLPVEELALAGGLWLLLAGLALDRRTPILAGGAVALVALARFAALTARSALARRGPLEPPLAHLLAGGAFLAQAAGFGLAAAAGAATPRLVTAYVILLLVGWAGGVVIGHAGKLLSLSLWVWWPPGPRPKQAQLFPHALGLVEAAIFATGVEVLALGVLAGSGAAARAGAGLLLASALLAAAGAALTWRRRPRAQRDGSSGSSRGGASGTSSGSSTPR